MNFPKTNFQLARRKSLSQLLQSRQKGGTRRRKSTCIPTLDTDLIIDGVTESLQESVKPYGVFQRSNLAAKDCAHIEGTDNSDDIPRLSGESVRISPVVSLFIQTGSQKSTFTAN